MGQMGEGARAWPGSKEANGARQGEGGSPTWPPGSPAPAGLVGLANRDPVPQEWA